MLTSSTTRCVPASYETSQIKGKLRLIRMSLCGLPALRTFLRDPLGGRMHGTTGPFISRVNRQQQWQWLVGSDLPPNKKCIPRLLTPIMGGKNSPACPSLAPVTPTVRQGVDSWEVEEGVWNPGDSLSPPDISPVRPLIRQAGLGPPHLWAAVSGRGLAAPHKPRLLSIGQFQRPRPRRPTLRSRRTDRAPPHPPSREPSSALSTVVENTSFN